MNTFELLNKELQTKKITISKTEYDELLRSKLAIEMFFNSCEAVGWDNGKGHFIDPAEVLKLVYPNEYAETVARVEEEFKAKKEREKQ
jgi:hypothetical protein